MPALRYNGPRLLYARYKQLGEEIYATLDPTGQLRTVRLPEAVELAQRCVEMLPEERRNTLYGNLQEAIERRKECKAYFRLAPERNRRGHDTYIKFLEGILEQLAVYQSKATKDEKEVDAKEQLLEQDHQPSAEAEGVDAEEAEDGETALTPDQADFLDFLELLMALTRKAASLWERVAKHQLPIWVASIEIRILLREAEHLIDITKVLNELEWERRPPPKGLFPWATDRKTERACPPRLAQDWVDALDNVRNPGAAWGELTPLPSFFGPCLESILRPLHEAALGVVEGAGTPFIFAVLRDGINALLRSGTPHRSGSLDLTSAAELPLVTLVGIYFCSLVDRDLLVCGVSKPETVKLLNETREAVCAEMEENLDILPRLIKDGSVSEKEANAFRTATNQMMAWARACTEPMSLGEICVHARVHWADWHGPIMASNSNLLQTFLYLCEKRQLQAPATASATAGDQDGNDDERLLHALLKDSRIAPFLLMDGRPETVQQCISALQKWCHVSTKDGEYAHPSEMANDTGRRVNLVERSCAARKGTLLGRDIIENRYGLTKAARARLAAKEQADDESALERYLTWEMGVPNCLKLETALRNALQKTPLWGDTLANALLVHPDKDVRRRRNEWAQACANVIDSGLHTVANRNEVSFAFGKIQFTVSLQAAMAGMTLGVPGCDESLKSALADAVRDIIGWRASFDDELFGVIKPRLQTLSVESGIKSLLRDPEVELLACFACLVPADYAAGPGEGPRNEVIGNIFRDFMEEARPVLVQSYREKPGASTA